MVYVWRWQVYVSLLFWSLRMHQSDYSLDKVDTLLHRSKSSNMKFLPTGMEDVLDILFKSDQLHQIAHINLRLFSSMRHEMSRVHKSLLLHTESRWLPRGKVVTRLFKLRYQVKCSLRTSFTDFNLNEYLRSLITS